MAPHIHPGLIIARDLDDHDIPMTRGELAAKLGISRVNLWSILTAKQPITVPIAIRLEALELGSASLWLALQADYDIRAARRTRVPAEHRAGA